MVIRLEHSGSAPATTLASPLAQGAGSFSVVDGTGYPDGAAGQFTVTVDRNVAGVEETILCESRASNTFTVAAGGRGYSGTSDTTHEASARVEHTFTAKEADDINLALISLDARATVLEGAGVALFDDNTVYGATTPGTTRVTASSLGTVTLATATRLLIRASATVGFDSAGIGFGLLLGARLTPVGAGTAEADYLSSLRPFSSIPSGQGGFVSVGVRTPVLDAGTYQVRALMRNDPSTPTGQGVAFVWPRLELQAVKAL